jgi:diaminohydroxyphosphoribosylaminopyrimidine deaminase/5-amino-6-(5-phosphoribosylamino)uracil reductase
MTQRGARSDFQQKLRARGVEVVEFDFLTPHAVAAYCYDRGFLQCLWECGGTLAAPAIAAGVIHKTLAFIAPKLVSHAGVYTARLLNMPQATMVNMF